MTERQIVDGSLCFCRSMGAFSRLALRKCGHTEIERPDVPNWFEACFESYWRTTWRAVPTEADPDKITASEIGFYSGYFFWASAWLDSVEAAFTKLSSMPFRKISMRSQKTIDEAWEQAVLPGDLKHQLKEWEQDPVLAEFEPSKIIAKLPASEGAKFCTGMAKGRLGPSGSEDGQLIETDATPVYMLLMMGWPHVQQFRSVTVLHRWLAIFLGRNRVGSLQRVAKICERIGLKLKGRGAPRKTWPFSPRRKRWKDLRR